jgi:hypothetical protein
MNKYLLILVHLLSFLLILMYFWWVKTAIEQLTFEETIKEYLKVFPSFISNGRQVCFISLVLAAINMSITIVFVKKRYLYVLSIFLLVVNSLLFALNGLSLM